MTNRKGKQPAEKAGINSIDQQSISEKPLFIGRYLAIDSHLTERNGSTNDVYGLAGERPAGRKLVQDIANVCNQLHVEGYDVVSIFPIVSGRAVEATVEAAQNVHGRTYSKQVEVHSESSGGTFSDLRGPRHETKHYVDTGVGYSVTDGAAIIAKRTQ